VEVAAVITIGTSRAELGDPAGGEDTRRGIEVDPKTPEATRGYIDLADQLIELGDVVGGIEARDKARALVEQLGIGAGRDWLRAERAGELYLLGEWGDALRIADEFVRWSEAGGPHFLASTCRQIRGGPLRTRGGGRARP